MKSLYEDDKITPNEEGEKANLFISKNISKIIKKYKDYPMLEIKDLIFDAVFVTTTFHNMLKDK
jgi:hypothetical protein